MTRVDLTDEEGEWILRDFHDNYHPDFGPDYSMPEPEPGEMEQKFINAFPEIAAKLKRQREYDRIWHNEIEMNEGILTLSRATWAVIDFEERFRLNQEIRGHELNLMLELHPDMTDLVEESWLAIFLPIAEKLRLDKFHKDC